MLHHLDGRRFGRLVVLRRGAGAKWICQCDCGRVTLVVTTNLTKGNSKSCGCARNESITKHGLTSSPEYSIWRGMRSRCQSNSAAFRNYADRGIGVCPEWSDFVIFLKDMGQRPGKGFEIDRIDNEKGYSKENCRWVRKRINLNNKRTNRLIEYNGMTRTIAEWAAILEMNYRTINNRINRGWPIDRALSEAVKE